MSKSKIVLLHLSFWIILLAGVVFMSFGTPYLLHAKTRVVLVLHILMPVFFYFAYFTAFKILQNKKYILIAVIVLTAAFCIVWLCVEELIGALYLFGFSLFWIMLGGISGYFFDWFRKDKKQTELEAKNIESELALLKNQINPHFLFNTLHNIDALITANPEKASDTLIRLSDLMRYMTYDSNDSTVELSREITYLRNYVNLQMLCHGNKNMMQFTVEGSTEHIHISPMLFIPFIENAFKHASQKDMDDNIRITFIISGHRIMFEISNRYNRNNTPVQDKYNGVGLNTVKRRLELLYPDRHVLNIFTDDTRFHVKLSIDV